MLERIRGVGVVLLLAAQIVGIARARVAADRYFASAPLHEVADFRISVLGADRVSNDELARRFVIPDSARTKDGFRELNAFDPMLARIRRIECARAHPSAVRVDALVDGHRRMETIRCPR